MKSGRTVSIFQRPLTGEDYEGEAKLVKKTGYPDASEDRFEEGEDAHYTEHWYVIFDGDEQEFMRDILVKQSEDIPVYNRC